MKFITDRTLGKLARKLRALGFDTVYRGGGKLEEAAKEAAAEGRVLLTRSRRVQERGEGFQVLVVEANDPEGQIDRYFLSSNCGRRQTRFFPAV
jgi:uncharacterized protein with PIN domain